MSGFRALAIDLFCGLGGWTDGLRAEGFDVIGFDIEQHAYGDQRYAGQLVVQDVLTLHGSQFRSADLIVASPPCQEYSYMAMPWSRAKQIAAGLRGEDRFPDGYKGSRSTDELNALFNACFRIQREASMAAGRYIPLVVENVRGAQPWVGRAKWNYGSYYLWGDIPALMPPLPPRQAHKFNPDGTAPGQGSWFAVADSKNRGAQNRTLAPGYKSAGLNWSDRSRRGQDFTRIAGAQARATKQPGLTGQRDNGKGSRWFQDGAARTGSKSNARKAASAIIAKIPYELSRHIAAVYKPERQAA